MTQIITGTVAEDSSFSVLARVDANGTDITQAATSSITYSAWDKADSSTTVASGTLTVSSVVYDTLQTDGRWSADATGYNFKHDIGATVLTSGGKTYRFEYKVTMTDGGVSHLIYDINTVELWGS